MDIKCTYHHSHYPSPLQCFAVYSGIAAVVPIPVLVGKEVVAVSTLSWSMSSEAANIPNHIMHKI